MIFGNEKQVYHVSPMIKTIFIFFSYLAFLLLGIFSSDTVLVENNTPSMLVPGVKSLVEVNVRKGDVQGFSKLELTLPKGFVATPADIQGASFTFSGDKAKFVWMNLPEEPVFKVTYYIESEPGVEGAYEVKGLFSYVKENIREDIYVPTRTIAVRQPVENPLSVDATTYTSIRVEEPVAEMACERIIERMGDNEYLVRLKVNNNRIVGFGKILEILPDNCSTNRDNDGGAVITQDANSIKFVWFEVPNASSFEVSYRVLCISDGTVPIIRGQLSYTENGNPFTVDVTQTQTPADLVPAQNNQIAQNTPVSEVATVNTSETSSETVNENKAVENTAQVPEVSAVAASEAPQNNAEAAVKSEQTPETNNKNNVNSVAENKLTESKSELQVTPKSQENSAVSDPVKSDKSSKMQSQNEESMVVAKVNGSTVSAVTAVPSAEKGITYKVQILAAHRIVDKSYLKKKFSFEEEYNIEHHNGWVKYTTGNFTQYKDARDARVKITNDSSKLPGPFVTAYNDGERITVQEAILISKQLWYK
jgi:hypothetical protein